ncbi:MAG: MFS transporter [Acetobacterium sp.]|nr:MFS transporter [Bacillota bacterium]MCG2728686.1 MFS transporter [Acetobacterium sp.]
MSVEMSKTKRILATIAIMATAIAVMADLAINPIIGVLYKTYPESMGYVNYFVSGPMLVIVFASLLTAALLKKMDKKIVMIAGGVIFAVGAILGVFVDDWMYMCVMRTLVGLGAGIVNVVAVALIADLYTDSKTRAKITGYYNAALSLVGVIFSYFAGMLSSGQPWQSVFMLYWTAVPMVILLILFIPSIKPSKETAEERAKAATGVKEPLGWRFWWMSFGFFLLNIVLGGTVLYYLSPYIFENNLGGTELAGISASVKSIVGFLICLGFGFIYGKLKRYTVTTCYAIAAVSLFILVLYPSVSVLLIVGTIGACTYKIAFSNAYAHGFNIVPKSRYDDSVSVITAVYGIGSFISTYYATWLLGVMNTESFTKTWTVSAIILVAMVIADIVVASIEKKQFPTGKQELVQE